jgi:glycosyl transferase family 4
VAASIAEIVLRERPQAVQLATTTSEGYFGLWLRRWLGLPFFIYAHGNEVLQAMRASWPLARRALVSADRVLANSRFTASLVRDAGVAPERASSSILDATPNHSTRRSVTRVSVGGCWVSVVQVRSFYRSAGSFPGRGRTWSFVLSRSF